MKTSMIQRSVQFSAVLWFAGSILLLAMSLLSGDDGYSPGLIPELYFCAVILLSPVTFALFGWDKWKAGHDGNRIPEKTLHMLAFLGGWPGSVIGQMAFRHKTVKPSFRFVLGLIVAVHLGLSLFALVRGFNPE